ncbi:MAG: methyltransferase domain-containing protein, partial [Gammaproteobacteria bacterium]|nr:methyltransferase domain-containing protein [Gammaproteobacteria bacterium]
VEFYQQQLKQRCAQPLYYSVSPAQLDEEIDCLASYADDSMDYIIVSHILDDFPVPEKLLASIHRVLRSDGLIIISGRRRYSWLTLHKLLDRCCRWPHIKYRNKMQTVQHLRNTDFFITQRQHYSFSPLLAYTSAINFLGRYCWPFCANGFMICAKKHMTTVTPLKTRWRKRKINFMPAAGLASSHVCRHETHR